LEKAWLVGVAFALLRLNVAPVCGSSDASVAMVELLCGRKLGGSLLLLPKPPAMLRLVSAFVRA
jgi:hypothetical protein